MAHLNIPQDRAKKILKTLEDEMSPHDYRLIREIFDDSIRLGLVTIIQDDHDIPPES